MWEYTATVLGIENIARQKGCAVMISNTVLMYAIAFGSCLYVRRKIVS